MDAAVRKKDSFTSVCSHEWATTTTQVSARGSLPAMLFRHPEMIPQSGETIRHEVLERRILTISGFLLELLNVVAMVLGRVFQKLAAEVRAGQLSEPVNGLPLLGVNGSWKSDVLPGCDIFELVVHPGMIVNQHLSVVLQVGCRSSVPSQLPELDLSHIALRGLSCEILIGGAQIGRSAIGISVAVDLVGCGRVGIGTSYIGERKSEPARTAKPDLVSNFVDLTSHCKSCKFRAKSLLRARLC